MTEVLVCYPSPAGPTAQIAMTVAEQVSRHGIGVELRPLRRAPLFPRYCGIVLGGAVADERWDSQAVDYLRQLSADQRVWVFHTCSRAGGGGPPAVVKALAAQRGQHEVPVFVDTDPILDSTFYGRELVRRRGADPATQWADSLARELRAGSSAPAGRPPWSDVTAAERSAFPERLTHSPAGGHAANTPAAEGIDVPW